MTQDIASLGVKIDTSEVSKGTADLDGLAQAGAKAEKATDSLSTGSKKASVSIKAMAAETKAAEAAVDGASKSFKALHGGTSALEAGMFSLGNSIKNGTFVDSLKSTQEAKAWLASLNVTTKESSAAFLDASKKLTFLSTGMKGLGAWSGPGSPVFGQIGKQGIEAAAGLATFNRASAQTTISAKQTAAALRGVPAQFTDIITSLQGGQAPLTVLLQQGGQLKDMFGGVGPAAKALGGYVAGLVNPFTLAAAAAAGLGIAYYKGSKEADEYSKSLILTGGSAGVTADQLADMAQQVSTTIGTTGAAAAVLATLAGSGKIASASYLEVASAAVSMQEATGKAVGETIAEFNKLAGDPVRASAALNEQYHYLTASVYSQIVALEEQGKHAEAVKLATDRYADAINDRTPKILENLSLWEKAYNLVAKAADGLKEVGRAPTNSERIQTARDTLGRLETRGGSEMIPGEDTVYIGEKGKQSLKDYIKGLEVKDAAETEYARKQKERADIELAGQKAIDKLKAISDSNLTNEQKRNKLLDEYKRTVDDMRKADPNNPLIQADVVAKNIQNIKDKNKDPAGKANQLNLSGYNDAQNALKDLRVTYTNSTKELEAQQKAGLITQQGYLDQRTALIRAEREEVTSGYQAEIAALEAVKDKAGTTGQQRIELDQKIADARTSMVKAQKDADSELEVLATNEEGRLKKQSLAIKTYTDALQQQVLTLRQQGQREAASLGLGDRQKGLQGQFNSIDDKANAQRIDLANQYGDGSRGMSLDEYNAKLQAVAQSQKDLRDAVVDNYNGMTEAQGSWTAGASSAWANYLESARDVAGQTKSLFTNAFSSMEDAIVNFAMTGKLSFADFAKSILADMARIATRQASSAILSSLFSAGVNYFAGGGGSTSAGSTQAGYTGTDLSNFTPGSVQANGGAWSGGVQMFANGGAFTNSILNKPTPFAMAGGKTGLAGEAGPEAIMPLTRTAGGKLGVMAMGGGGAGSTQINVEVHIDGDGNASSSADAPGYDLFGKELATFVEQKYQELRTRDMRQGGVINNAIKGR